MKFVSNIFVILVGVSIVNTESSEVKDVKSLIGRLSRENHLSHALCNCENRGIFKSRHSPMSEEERKQRLSEAIERLQQFLALFGHVDSFLTHKTNGLIRIMGKAVESDLEESDYDELRDRPHRRHIKRYWPYVDSVSPTEIVTSIPEA